MVEHLPTAIDAQGSFLIAKPVSSVSEPIKDYYLITFTYGH